MAKEVEEEFVGAIELVRPVARDAVMARLFERLFACFTNTYTDSLAREESLLCCLMGLLRRHGMKRPMADHRSACVAKAVRRLDAALDEPASLAELAALSGVSRFKLLRSFAREVGITPHAYLVQKRVRLARQLLANGQAPADAALQAGFADQSHMTRTFMRQLGFTPSRYRAAVA